jgi:chromosome segregation ATPase
VLIATTSQSQQDTVNIPTSAALGLSMTIMGALIIGVGKFVVDQALRRWSDRLTNLEQENRRLELQIGKAEIVSPKQIEILEQRFNNLGGALQDTQKLFQDTQKDLIKLRQEISTDYVRREDWIRFSSTLEAKMDALNRKIEDRFDTLTQRFSK